MRDCQRILATVKDLNAFRHAIQVLLQVRPVDCALKVHYGIGFLVSSFTGAAVKDLKNNCVKITDSNIRKYFAIALFIRIFEPYNLHGL